MLLKRPWQALSFQQIHWLATGTFSQCQVLRQSHRPRCLWSWTSINVTSDCENRRYDVKRLCQEWSAKYKAAGIPDPTDSAELIIAHVLGKKMIHEVRVQTKATIESLKTIDALCGLRLKREPVQYIIGEWDFMDMTLIMKPPVLIPRPETEELCELVRKDLIQKGQVKESLRFLDIGCGSGAISLYLLKQLPQSSCIAVDISKEACDLTMENAEKHGLTGKISVLQADVMRGDILETLPSSGVFDIVVSNPPYIPTSDMGTLMPEVYKFESHKALHGGDDGLDITRRIIEISKDLLKPKGCLWLEVDIRHPSVIQEHIDTRPDFELEYVKTYTDLTKRPRFCQLERR